MGDIHSEETIVPLEDLDFLQHQYFFNQEGNVSQLLLKQEWLFHITNVQFVFHSSITN